MGQFPSAMLAKAPRTADFFDEVTGECKGATECDVENRRHIRRMKRLQVKFDWSCYFLPREAVCVCVCVCVFVLKYCIITVVVFAFEHVQYNIYKTQLSRNVTLDEKRLCSLPPPPPPPS